MLNRAAILVRPAAPFLAWARSLDDSGAVPNPDGEQTVYLVPGFSTQQDSRELLQSVYPQIFERELHDWHTREADWPKDCSFAAFQKWFRVEMHSVVEDLCADPIEDDEL